MPKDVRPEGHQCFLQPVETRQPAQVRQQNNLDDDVEVENDVEEQEFNLMFFDFECIQDEGVHTPNLCVIQNESGDETVFSGPDTKNEFCEWLFQPQHVKTTLVAHNLQAYDGYFILQYLYNQGIAPELITRGAKILSHRFRTKDKIYRLVMFYPNEIGRFSENIWPHGAGKRTFPSFC